MNDNESPLRRAGRLIAFRAQLYAVLCFLSALIGTVFFDGLTSVLLVLSTLLFWIVCHYSNRYMAGDPGQPRFTGWLCLTGTFVFALVLSGNLLLFALAWCGISLSLHQLLRFYGDRPGALLAARKKFLISRLGDISLVAALALTYREFGTWEFQGIFVAAERLRAAGPENIPLSVSAICGLLVFAALLKSAQVPFHSWLPDTMETPTPVSALMHAGIINAGGILIIRLSPLISLSDNAMLALCLTGGFTALFASIVMLTQASVKRCLAFSTVAQMGFMMLECGLGAFHLALLHLVAHSLYKAHAFLSSGGVVLARSERSLPQTSPAAILCALFASFATTYITASSMGVAFVDQVALNGIFSLFLARMLWGLWGGTSRVWRIPLGLAAGAILGGVYFALDRVAQLVVKPLHSNATWAGVALLPLFFLVAAVHTRLTILSRTGFGKHLFVHARNGFYINTVANRLTTALWPRNAAQEGI